MLTLLMCFRDNLIPKETFELLKYSEKSLEKLRRLKCLKLGLSQQIVS